MAVTKVKEKFTDNSIHVTPFVGGEILSFLISLLSTAIPVETETVPIFATDSETISTIFPNVNTCEILF